MHLGGLIFEMTWFLKSFWILWQFLWVGNMGQFGLTDWSTLLNLSEFVRQMAFSIWLCLLSCSSCLNQKIITQGIFLCTYSWKLRFSSNTTFKYLSVLFLCMFCTLILTRNSLRKFHLFNYDISKDQKASLLEIRPYVLIIGKGKIGSSWGWMHLIEWRILKSIKGWGGHLRSLSKRNKAGHHKLSKV